MGIQEQEDITKTYIIMGSKFKRIEKDNFEKVESFLKENISSPTHWIEWNELVSKYYNTDFFYFAYEDNGIITGICPVHSIKNKLNHRLISGPKEFNIPYGGWIKSKQYEPEPLIMDLKNNESFEAFTLPHISEFDSDYSNFNLLKEFETSIIDLTNSEENIWNGLPSQRRNKIRKALKLDVKVLDFSDIGIDKFYDLYTEANEQYGLNNLSKDFFKEFLNLKKNIKAEVLTAGIDGELLGAVVTVSDKFYSIYWLGLRLESAPNNGYFDLLQWEAIKRAKLNGCRYYDLCYIEKDRLPNIYKFKTDYSSNIVKISNINLKPIVYRVINKIQKLI